MSDNTALIADARAWAKDAARVGRNIVRDVDSGILFARRLSDALEAALAAAGVTQPEPEYEYGVALAGTVFTRRTDLASAERLAQELAETPSYAKVALMQRTIGAWEPAPNHPNI